MRATDLLRSDHETVRQLFTEFETLGRDAGDARQQLFDKIADELEVHAKIEEEIFYPAVRQVSNMIGEAEHEHDKVKSLIGDIEGRNAASDEFAIKVQQLKAAVEHHVAEEEGPIFLDAEQLGDAELEQLGRRLQERKDNLKTSLLQRGMRAAKQAVRKIA
jgi:hemerythrin superfamily protein